MARWKNSSTAKGVTPKSSASDDTPDHSVRYTPPDEARQALDLPSPMWVPVLMGVLLAIGMILIVVNYLGWWPGAPNNNYLGVGLLFILGGTITATRWR
jgi:hypothetical protein